MNLNFLKIYFTRELLLIFFTGITSGIPLYLILSTLTIWLTRENIDISTIGLFALTQLPWTVKFLWAPFLDNYKIPFLTNIVGHRKAWLFVIQIFLILSIILDVDFPLIHLIKTTLPPHFLTSFAPTICDIL